jgi:uncharacterized protein (DUF1501 family)
MHPRTPIRRRDLLAAGGLSWFGLTLPELLAGRASAEATIARSATFGRAKRCILLFMWGGPAHQDTWDLKPNAPAEVRGEFAPISTNVPGLQIAEHFPLLARQADRLCVLRSMTHTDVNHTTATHFLLTGQPPPPGGDLADDWPSLGSVLAQQGRGTPPLPPFVSMRPIVPGDVPRFVEESHGQFSGWLSRSFNPLTIDDDPNRDDYRVADFALQEGISPDRLEARSALLRSLEQQRTALQASTGVMTSHYARAFDLLDSAVGQDAFDLSREADETRERYGRNPHGQTVLQARRLVERGVPLVTVSWPNDGIKNVSVYWDTHSRNFIDLKERLMPVADRAFTALLDDLAMRGMLEDTLVIWTGEFGRTPRVGQRNSDAGAGADGRDHWPNCFTSVLAGGGVPGGQVYGSSDAHAAYPDSNPTRPVDLMATVHHLLGLPPHMTLDDAQGRPHVVVPGDVIRGIL